MAEKEGILVSTGVLSWRQRLYYLFSIFVLIGFLVLLTYETVKSYGEELAIARQNAISQTRLLEGQVRATTEKIDVALQGVVRHYPQGLPLKASRPQVNEHLKQVLTAIPESQSLRMVDAAGNFVFDASGVSPLNNVADRAYFKEARDSEGSRLVISAPIFARNTRNWVFTLSRALEKPGGGFDGLVQAAVRAEFFENIFASADVGKDGVVALYDRQLQQIAQFPKNLETQGKAVTFPELAAQLVAAPGGGSFEGKLAVDGKARLYAYQTSRDLPFVVLVGVSETEILLNWLSKGALYGVGMLILVASLWRLVFQWNQQHRQALAEVDVIRQAYDANVRHTTALLNSLPDPAWLKDKEGRFLAVNEAYLDMVQQPQEAVIGKTVFDLWPASVARAFTEQDQQVMTCLSKQESEGEVSRKDGSYRCYHYIRTPVIDKQGCLVGTAGLARDMTQRKLSESRIQQLVTSDVLTELPNRNQLNIRLGEAIAQAMRSHQKVALLVLDIDHFKHVNESLGHAVGDQLIREMAVRLRKVLKERDTISRLGGDEFAILLVDCNSASLVAYVAQRLIEEASRPFHLAGQDLMVSASVGISICPDDGADMEVLLKNADLAMYHVKASGRSGYHFFTQELNQRAQERLSLENNLRKGLKAQEFRLRYQPQMDVMGQGHLIGFEALVRWHHPVMGMISPARFIPVAEDSNLIIPLGEWVLREACRQNKEWQDRGFPPVVVAVNISAVQFRQKDFAPMVSRVLAETGLGPQYLELEITESIIMGETDKVIEILRQLREIGVTLSIDDFGTGYSSLSYLKRFPIDKIKIDQSFVRDISTDSDDAAIVEAILAIAGKLGLKAIAEGVETEEQLMFLQLRECSEVQGYYFSPPVEPDKAEKFFGDPPRS